MFFKLQNQEQNTISVLNIAEEQREKWDTVHKQNPIAKMGSQEDTV